MKRLRSCVAIFLCLVAFLLPGCGNEYRTSFDGQASLQESEFSIYLLKENFSDIADAVAQFRTENPEIALSITQFDTTEELDDTLIRDFNTNTGPDVVLFDYTTTLDLQKMAKSNSFLTFDSTLQEKVGFDSNDYIPAALEGCQIDGNLYFIPISFLPQIEFYSTHMQAQYQFQSNKTTRDEYYQILSSHAEQYREDPYVISIFEQYPLQGKTDISSTQAVLASAGILQNFSLLEGDALRKTIDWIKLIQAQNSKFERYEGDFWDHFDTFRWNDNLFYTVSGYDLVTSVHSFLSTLDGIYEDNGNYVIFPMQDDPQSYSVLGTFFGAVGKDCDCPETAFSFLTLVADSYYMIKVTQNNPMWFAPVRTDLFEKALDVCTTNQLRVSGMLVDPLSETEAERLRDFYDSIANYVLPNASLVNFIESEFAGYFQDTENYESAAVNFSRKYALYLNE